MNEKLDDLPLRSRIIYVYAMFISHWNHHWSSMTPWFLRGIEAGYQSGDMLYLAYSAQDCILWDPTIDLATQSRETRKYLAIVKDCEYQDSYDSGTLSLRMQLNFQGLTDGELSMNDASFDEDRCLAGMRERRFMTGVANYHIYKAEIHLLYGDFAGALPHVEVMDRMIASAMSLPQLVRYRIVAFLVRAALLDRLPAEERAAERSRLAGASRADDGVVAQLPGELRASAAHDGGRARAAGRSAPRRRWRGTSAPSRPRTRAASGATRRWRTSWPRDCSRRSARRAPRKATCARRAICTSSGARCGRWRSSTARIRSSPSPRAPRARTTGAHAISMDTTALDMGSVIKASQTISGEMVVEQLLRTTLQILLENAGASVGYFVVREGDALVLRSQAGAVERGAARTLPMPLAPEGEQVLPLSIVNHVLRTGAPLVLADGAERGPVRERSVRASRAGPSR